MKRAPGHRRRHTHLRRPAARVTKVRRMPSHRHAAQLLVSGSTMLTEAIRRHMPAGPYRDFTGWAFSPRNPRQPEFLRMTGLSQLVRMNVTLLSGLVEDEQWP